MAVRKCSRCHQPGHTVRTCPDTVAPAPDLSLPVNTVMLGKEIEAPFAGLCEGNGCSFEAGDLIAPTEPFTGYVCANCYSGDVAEDPSVVEPKHWDRPTAANVGKAVAKAAQSINAFTDAFTAPVPKSGRPDWCRDCGGSGGDPNSDQEFIEEAGLYRATAPCPRCSGTGKAPVAAQTVVDEFVSPVAPTAPEPGHGPKTERLGYICKDPALGDFRRYKNGNKKGITRTTTFVKAASDTYAIAQWNKRNVLLGAARRPDIAARAHGMDVNEDRAQLDRWVGELEDVAGGNVASNMGTDVHAWTERVDAKECTIADVPPTYRPHVERYVKALREAGLVVVPELRERTTFIDGYGGVCGTFDAILFHEPTGTYVLSDTKSGKNVGKYGWSEIEAQEWVYAHGYNKFGTYNWDTEEWEPPEHQVRMDYGLVIHMPFEGEHANTCRLLRTNLSEGASYAALCGSVREHPKGKPAEWALPAVQRDWVVEFAAVQTKEQASSLWAQAKAAGLPLDRVADLVVVAQSALRRKN